MPRLHFLEGRKDDLGRERQRSTRVRRRDRRRQAPHVLAVAAKTIWVRCGVRTLCVGGPARVLEVIDALFTGVGVVDAAEVEPDVRILMDEERRVVDELLAVEGVPLVVSGAGLP